jgi:hypothetical protein
MNRLASLYQLSWSSRIRGRVRAAFTVDGGELTFKADFMRWLSRRMERRGEMVLKKEIESDNLLILIFRKDAGEQSAVRAVAEAILELGDSPEGMPSAAIHYAIAGHPFSGGQRFREIVAAYRRQWPGILDGRWKFPAVKSHSIKKNRYYFSEAFLQWLRASLPEIERVCYPVQTKKRFRDESLDNPKTGG